MRKAVSIHSDFYTELRSLPPEKRGDLVDALIAWAEESEVPALSPECAILFRLMLGQMERVSKVNAQNGKRGGAPGGNKNANKTSETSEGAQNKPSVSVSDTVTVSVPKESTGRADAQPPTQADTPQRKKYGTYGWVRLTDEEYHRLSNDLGESEVKRCIAYIDESAQATGNKNKWRDWNLVVRKCNREQWGLRAADGRRGVPPPVSDEERDKVARDELAALRRIIGQEDTG